VVDAAGNSTTCEQLVTVSDDEAPSIACPSDIVATTDAGDCFATVDLGTPVTADNCTVASVSNDAPATFPIGVTTVTWTVVDAAGNSTTCEQLVTVSDNEAPSITCIDAIAVSAEIDMCSAFVDIPVPSTNDNCAFATLVNDYTGTSNASGTYPVGQTEITWTATDIYGNASSCTTVVTVTDDQVPSITCTADIVVSTEPGVCGATVNYELPVFTDNCEGSMLVMTGGLASGEFFETGVTTITYVAIDQAGNASTCTFTVTVEDTEAPSIACVGNITVNSDLGVCGASVVFDLPVGWDNCEVHTLTLIEGLASGSVFPVGLTTVTFEATDLAGNATSCSFTVEVIDVEAPEVSCASDIFMSNDEGACGAEVSYSLPVATDNCAVTEVVLVEGFASGDFFPVGTTTVTYAISDAAGNTSFCSFDVVITDDEVPTIVCANDLTIGNDYGQCGAVVNYPLPNAFDNCSDVTVTLVDGLPSGSFFELGSTELTFIATDASGNTATCSYTITVVDNQAPIIICQEDIVQVDPVVEYNDPEVVDNCFATITMIEGLPSGSTFDHGYTVITYVAQDLAGNTDTCSFNILINTPPIAENDSTFFAWDQDKIEIDVIDNDSDPDGDDFNITEATAQNGDVVISNNMLIYTPLEGWCGMDTVTYVICDIYNACDTAIVVIEVECELELFIPEGFSPNGDGVNDVFEIIGLEYYPDNRLTVYNRWGHKVYDAKNYQNDWDGRSEAALTLGSGLLPEGTYFLVFEPGNGFKPVKGYVYINH
jgi:gliding motility-associated-like protein